MRKLFLLLPALVLSLIANATVQTISPSSEESDSNIRSALSGTADTIILNAGNYKEADQIHLKRNAVIMAAEGADVTITPKYYCDFTLGAKVKIIGIKFDGSVSNQQAIRVYDESAGKELRLENCEFYNFAKDVISGDKAEYTTDSCIVNNCYFHNNNYSAIYFNKSSVEGKQTIYGLKVTNSTFANNDPSKEYRALIDVQSYNYSATDDIEVIVDHCTFYNNTVMNYDYSAIRTRIVNRTTVSNCIFAHPSAQDWYATNVWAGSVTNCLAYNFNNGYNAPTKTEANTGNPLFTDAANGDFTLAGNWVSINISPARGAATDGSDLGDPRWYSAETLPFTDFASPYDLLGSKALLNGNIELNANDHIAYKGSSEPGIATWKLHTDRTCALGGIIDMEAGNTSGCTLKLIAFDADGNKVDSLVAPYTDKDLDVTIPGCMYIPEEGDYTFKLYNVTGWSSSKIEKITLSYFGGAVIPVAPDANTTLNVADAWFNTGATRADGTITYSSWNSPDSWIKWNIATSETKFYDVSIRINTTNAHRCAVAIYEDEAADPIATVQESYSETTGDGVDIVLGRVNLVGGKNYVVKVTNPVSGSAAKIASVTFAPVAASATELPGTLEFNQAVLSANAHVTDGKLYFAPIGDTNPIGEWARWAVTTDHNGLFLFTMGVNSTNSQSYKITIYNDSETRIDSYEAKPSSGAQTITHYFALPTGNYSVKVENTTAWSRGYLTSFVVTEPSVVSIGETATDNSAWASKVNDENTYDVQIIRTLRAGMYNTFCLPFAVASDMCKDVFGNDVEIYTLEEATVEGEVLNVTLNNSSDIYQGTPVFIKPSTDIVNPIFAGVQFKTANPAATTKTNANFVGTFVSTTLNANTDILYLGPDNTLYYPETDIPIKGFRAWFTIHDAPSPAPAIRRMNIVRNPGEATSINLINETKNNGKRIENGQLIIIRDGIRYNAMGMMIK